MFSFASNLRQRAEELGISNSEVARRAGLSEQRYGHYVRGDREPDLATLVRIARVTGTTPNWLLGFDGDENELKSGMALLKDRLNAAANAMTEQQLQITVIQAEAVVAAK